MTNMQRRFLSYIYKEPKTVDEICARLSMPQNDFKELANHGNFDQSHHVDAVIPFGSSIVRITPHGTELVETYRRDTLRFWILFGINAVIAAVALLNSIFAFFIID